MERQSTSYTHGFRTSVDERISFVGDELARCELREKTCSEIIRYGIDLSRSVYRRHGIPTGAKDRNGCFGRKGGLWVLWKELSEEEKTLSFERQEKVLEAQLWSRFEFKLGSEPHLASIVMQTSFNLKFYYDNKDLEKIAHYAYALSNSIRNLKEVTTRVRGKSLGSVIKNAIAGFGHGAKGGKTGSVTRRVQSQIKKDECIAMARDIIRENPGTSKFNIALDIIDRREKEKKKEIGHSTILGYLKGVELE